MYLFAKNRFTETAVWEGTPPWYRIYLRWQRCILRLMWSCIFHAN